MYDVRCTPVLKLKKTHEFPGVVQRTPFIVHRTPDIEHHVKELKKLDATDTVAFFFDVHPHAVEKY